MEFDEFDRDAALRRWHRSLIRGGLIHSEVDERERRLARIEAELGEHLSPEEAFWVAARRVGAPRSLTRGLEPAARLSGWGPRLQWALLGLLGYWLLVPVARTLLYALAAVLALVPPLRTVAAAIDLYAAPLGLALAVAAAIIVVRRLGPAPERVDRALGYLASHPRIALLVGLGLVAWQVVLSALEALASLGMSQLVYVPGGPGPLPSPFWLAAWSVVSAALPALVLLLVVRIQQRSGSAKGEQA